MFGGIEAGGTKFVCMLGNSPDEIQAEIRFPTTTPVETLGKTINFFLEQSRQHPLQAVGIGSFGPVDLQPGSSTFGYITTTPKPGWPRTDVAGPIHQALNVPVAFDTDVNAAALGEYRWGAAQGMDPFLYMTIGTGIGGGGIFNGAPMHGLVHPENGHIRLPHNWEQDPFVGICPYHGDCFEGLASGPAMKKRWGQPAESLPAGHPAWDLEAHYVALAVANMICDYSPRRIILGGGVMSHPGLFELVRQKTLTLLNGYIQSPAITDHIDTYIVPPALGGRAGVLGAIALAQSIV